MNHQDHVALLAGGVDAQAGTWADFGSGDGAFTLALAELLGNGGPIYAIDRDGSALQRLARSVAGRFPDSTVITLQQDFTRPISLPPLDGLVMANSLHFIEDKATAVRRLAGYLRPGGTFLLVEYDVDRGNHWVPYPLSFVSWQRVSLAAGLVRPRFLASRPSRFLQAIYAAAATRPSSSTPA